MKDRTSQPQQRLYSKPLYGPNNNGVHVLTDSVLYSDSAGTLDQPHGNTEPLYTAVQLSIQHPIHFTLNLHFRRNRNVMCTIISLQ